MTSIALAFPDTGNRVMKELMATLVLLCVSVPPQLMTYTVSYVTGMDIYVVADRIVNRWKP